MGLGLRRTELQQLAELRLADALLLLRNRRWSSAYYLAGYSVEFGLKACVAQQIRSDVIPDPAYIKRVFTHELPVLINLSGLSLELKKNLAADAEFAAHWGIASQWSPESRYESIDASRSQYLCAAVSDPQSGVLAWIRQHW